MAAQRPSEIVVIDASPTSGGVLLWVALASVVALPGALLLRRRLFREWSVLVVAALVGTALSAHAERGASRQPTSPGVVELVGVIATEPRLDEPGADELAEHAVRQASQSFRLAVHQAVVPEGPVPWHAEVTCRVGGMAPLPARGTTVRVRGWIKSVLPLRNPGTKPRAAVLVVSALSSRAIQECRMHPAAQWMVDARISANRSLQASMPGWADESTRALVQAMTTGVRLPGLAGPAAEFREAGMSHVLAISGFNVAVLVAATSGASRMVGIGFRMRAVVSMMTALAFLAVTEPDTSVVRAGMGAGLAAAASMRGGNARGLGTLGSVALASMAVDIECIRGAGFQLSYGVVVALLVLGHGTARRWIDATASFDGGLSRGRAGTRELVRIAREALLAAAAASLVAWTVSTPIALWHGGSISVAAAPLSIMTMPAAAGATIFGVLAMVLGAMHGGASAVAGTVSAACVELLSLVAHSTAESAASAIKVPYPPWWWCVSTLCAAWCMFGAGQLPTRLLWMLGFVLLLVSLCTGFVPQPAALRTPGSLTVDALAINRGACSVIRSDGASVLLNCGSWSSPELGSRTIVPALLSMGIRRVDAVVLVGRGLGSMSALPEVLSAVEVRAVIADESAARWIAESRDGAATAVRDALHQHGLAVQRLEGLAVAGDLTLRLAEVESAKRVIPLLDVTDSKGHHAQVRATAASIGGRHDPCLAAGPADGAAARTAYRRGTSTTQQWTGLGWR